MKIIIFAGGKGSRLWPLSRENSPKQFDKIFDGKSTLRMAIERIMPVFGIENVFIQTIPEYKQLILDQLPELPEDNIIIEPSRRNLGPAVCFAVNEFKKKGFSGPMAILWADHLMKNVEEFQDALKTGEKLIEKDPNRFVFIGERPYFPNYTLGWIKVGENLGNEGRDYFKFEGWKYKPEYDECVKMFESKQWVLNTGYFVISIEFLTDLYQKFAPEIYRAVVEGRYDDAERTHFDRAILEKIDLSDAVVLETNMGWDDPGTLYALKEALAKKPEDNVIQGQVKTLESKDCLLFNNEDGKIMAGIGLDGMIVVNTPDAIIVVPKNYVNRITEFINTLKEEGLDKYL